jgi:hypothetical protein
MSKLVVKLLPLWVHVFMFRGSREFPCFLSAEKAE